MRIRRLFCKGKPYSRAGYRQSAGLAALAAICLLSLPLSSAEEASQERELIAYGELRGGPVEAMKASQSEAYWKKLGYRRIYPAVKLPTTSDSKQRIEIWIRLPDDGTIATRYLKEQKRYSIRFPHGTRIDRVQRSFPEKKVESRHISDVRGTCLRKSGKEFFHVLKPKSGFPSPVLLGYRWPRGNEQQRLKALQSLTELLNTTKRELYGSLDKHQKVDCVNFFNDCANCHRYNKAPGSAGTDNSLPLRPTDASGFYAPLMVLTNSSPPSSARPVDRLAEDKYVSVTCGEQAAELYTADEGEYWRCPNEAIPMATFDVRSAMRAGDRHAQRVCNSRRFLYNRLDSLGKNAFRHYLEDCNTTPPK